MRTGAYAAQVVLPGEDLVHFQELEQQFLHDFDPSDVAQSVLVHQLAVITWKKLRLDRIEHSNYLGFIHREYLQVELAPVEFLSEDTHLFLAPTTLQIRREDLMADWELAINGQSLFPVDPLR